MKMTKTFKYSRNVFGSANKWESTKLIQIMIWFIVLKKSSANIPNNFLQKLVLLAAKLYIFYKTRTRFPITCRSGILQFRKRCFRLDFDHVNSPLNCFPSMITMTAMNNNSSYHYVTILWDPPERSNTMQTLATWNMGV